MARKAAERNERKGLTVSDEEREKAKNRRKSLVDPSYDEVEAALKAVKPCSHCTDKEPKRRNEAGNCFLCDSKGLMRDHDQRKWAAEFVLSRADPAPKSVEMVIDDHRDKEAILKSLSDLPESKVDELLKQMDIPVQGEPGE